MSRDDGGSEPHTLGEGKIIGETQKAVLAQIGDKEIWIPKSVLHDDSEAWAAAQGRDVGRIVVCRWWAAKNGLVD